MRQPPPLAEPAPSRSLLDGRVAIVTGSSSGIGRAIAVALARCGARIVCTDRYEADRDVDTDRVIVARGGEAVFVEGDVTRLDDHRHAVDVAIGSFGGLDIF